MSEHIMPFDGNGQPDFLSIINSEAEKVEPVNKVPPNLSAVQAPTLELPESLPTPPDQPKETSHLKASTFAEPVLPIDWFPNRCRSISVLFQNPTDVRRSMWWLIASLPLASQLGKSTARYQPLYELPMRLFLYGG